MKISVAVKTNAKKEEVLQVSDTSFKVCVKELPREGLANEAVCRLLAKYYGIAPSRITIVKGATSKRKIVEILY